MNFEDLWNREGVVLCENCDGYGSSLKEEQDRCSCCGGTGIKPTEAEPETTKNKDTAEPERRILWNRSAQ